MKKPLRGLLAVSLAGALLAAAAERLAGTCGPFMDVAADAFCPFVLEIFYLGITTGTTATTYDPAANVSRLQMAAFLSRTVDGALRRGGRRGPLDQHWTTKGSSNLGLTTVGAGPELVKSDGADLWVASDNDTVSRVRGSDGRLLETWTAATNAFGVLPAMGKILVGGTTSPGRLYRIEPDKPAGAVTTVATNLGDTPQGLAFDGARVWSANKNSVSIVTPGATIPWSVTTVTAGFGEAFGALYDGANVWITDFAGAIRKLDAAGSVLQTVTVGFNAGVPAFDGANIWVGAGPDSVFVVRASTGALLATLTGNGLNSPFAAAFDGQRVLVTSYLGDSVSLWKAADLTVIGTFGTGGGTHPSGACSDGINFWIALGGSNQLARF
ncbi:MAG TPA: S-layer homology domain-containing protein [Thermoanaerobaculia bacterium]|nr:S-layer homology domain-containing protein [Thermoanaerobaculia bacterium]